MHFLSWLMVLICLRSSLAPGSAAGQDPDSQGSPEQRFQAGIYAEEVKGDLHQALKIYQKIVGAYPDDRPLAAKAQLHIGLCYEKLGAQQASAAYQKVLENYPDQRAIAATAREHLNRLKASQLRDAKATVSPLVKYYFERFGVDITTSTSYDGKYLAYTDWTTGSLMIKELSDFRSAIAAFKTSSLHAQDRDVKSSQADIKNPKPAIRIVEANFSRSPEYAYHPAWSRDGKYIAYGWYRGPCFVELRVVAVADGKSRVAYSDSTLIVVANDWSPDGKTVVCETLNHDRKPDKWLALVRLDSTALQEIVPLDRGSRGMKFSPDGNYIAYDLQGSMQRDIHVLAWKDSLQDEQLNVDFPFLDGADAPVWSTDGKLILCRTHVRNELWAIPIELGRIAGKPYRIQTDLSNAILIMKGIKHPPAAKGSHIRSTEANFPDIQNAAHSFVEEFSSSVLDSAWRVFAWKGPNVYDYASFGRYSLTAHPGTLRYYADPMMNMDDRHGRMPHFSGWYWLYPSLELSRSFAGDRWQLEARATYHLVDGANGRFFRLGINFGPQRDQPTALQIFRGKEIHKESNEHFIRFLDRGIVTNENLDCRSPKDSLGVSQFSYIYRISRADTLIHIELSDDDGRSFKRLFSASLRPELRGMAQSLALSGGSWFVPAGAHADWDYVRLQNLDY